MTKDNIKIQVLVRGGWSTTYTITDANLDLLVDRGHHFASSYRKWPFTEGRASTTFASLITHREDGYLTGEYPEGWKSDSIKMMRIGTKEVEKREFYKFTQYLEDNAGVSDRIFTDYMRVYYVNPNIDLSGTVTLWGQYTPAVLADNDTVFIGEDEGDEAIIQMVMSYVYKRLGDENNARIHEETSRNILNEVWERIKAEQYKYESTPDDGMFKRFDVLKGGFDEINRDQF